MIDFNLEHIFSFTVELGGMDVIAPLPEGVRANVYIKSGRVEGPKVQGEIKPVGGNWSILHPDGVYEINYQLMVETPDQALIYITCDGTGDFGEGAYQQYFQDPGERGQGGREMSRYRPHRTRARCRTAHPDYLWLNRLFCLGIGQGDAREWNVVYDVYAVS
ncbi:MAG: DUF3237 domain-containing protein [Anaerolineae bacterium]|nr:DUF3237 domain-containing protein [Anaerolineae bacterium]MCB9103713.1 DUF3237 domain-containing protein [Anaerolineales bacterium]